MPAGGRRRAGHERFLDKLLGQTQVAAERRSVDRGTEQLGGHLVDRVVPRSDDPPRPLARLVAEQSPAEAAHRDAEPCRCIQILDQHPLERRSKVVELRVHPDEPSGVLGLTECDDVRRQGFEEVHGVAPLQDRGFARCAERVLGELADRLEQAIARRPASHLRDDQ